MNHDELAALVGHMRAINNDTQQCEVKESVQKIPSSLVETISAFANGNGGTIILGLSERGGFTPVKGFQAKRMQEAVNAECEKLTPKVRPTIDIIPFEGASVVVAQIPPMAAEDKPCYVTVRGRYQGSFIRTGDGDRKLTAYEVDRLLEEHRQPSYDDDIVPDATENDFDSALLARFIARQRELHPRVFASRSDTDILLAMHVLRRAEDERLSPTLGGLLALGTYPQQFFPRLNVTFTAFPGTTKAEVVDDERRYLDAQTIVGPIPLMVDDALNAVTKNMRTGAVIEGAFRKDLPDYPRKAVREAIANALMHRDYSPQARGSQVQVNMYVDRLEILNPGGLYGNVTVETLGRSGISSTRNQFLSNILETTPYPTGGYVVENRGTGYQLIVDELVEALMPPAKPVSTLTFFSLTFDKRRISASERGDAWVGGVDQAIVNALKERSSASVRELVELSGLTRAVIYNHVRGLVERGVVEPTHPSRSPKQRYRLSRGPQVV